MDRRVGLLAPHVRAPREHLWARANADNLTDEKYITSLYNVGCYSAPVQYKLAMGYRF